MAKQKLPKRFNLSSPRVALALVFVLVFMALGVYKLLVSSAATGPTEIMYFDHRRVSQTSTSVSIVDDTMDLGTAGKVAKLSAGGMLKYDPPMLSPIEKICYVLKVPGDGFGGGKAATVELGIYGNKKRVTIPPTKYYREYCVLAGSSSEIIFDSNVKHIAGDPIYVRHMSMYLPVPKRYQIVGRDEGFSCRTQGFVYTCEGTLYIQRPQKPETSQTITVNMGTSMRPTPDNPEKINRLVNGQLPLDAEIQFWNGNPVFIEIL
jgi:hypothetical protein